LRAADADRHAIDLIVTHGAIGGNALIYETPAEAGDTVVSVLPTYQQHYSIPESYGANVKVLKLREEHGFLADLDALASLVDDKTRLIAINNPNNPTGSLMDEALLGKIVEIAQRCGAYVLCDEVYRGTDQAGSGYGASIADLYERGISTTSTHQSRDSRCMGRTRAVDFLGQAEVGHDGAAQVCVRHAVARVLHEADRGNRRDVHTGQRARHGELCADRLRRQPDGARARARARVGVFTREGRLSEGGACDAHRPSLHDCMHDAASLPTAITACSISGDHGLL
jgi:hypothetical protein